MRVLVVLALLGGCAGGARPAVIPMLSELPRDPQRRDAVLDSAVSQPGPEQRKPLSPKWRKVETAAATAAAIIGGLFSKSKSVMLGGASLVDENRLFKRPPGRRPSGAGEGEGEGEGEEKPSSPPSLDVPATDLVPWVRLKQPTPQ
jgi:hypothetical protein